MWQKTEFSEFLMILCLQLYLWFLYKCMHPDDGLTQMKHVPDCEILINKGCVLVNYWCVCVRVHARLLYRVGQK